MNISSKPFLALAVGTVVILAAFSTPAISSVDDESRDVDKLLVVDCMLPGKIMKLGGGARYMSARRPIKTTGADCEIRGGEYIAYDRASYASSLNVWLPDAKAGDPKAQTYVGEMFEKGLGTMPDYATAVSWYRKAAEQGYDRAQMNLGSMYERGLGVEVNELEALNWYRKATGMAEDDLVFSSEVEALEAETEELRIALATSKAEVDSLKESLNLSQRQMNNSQARLDSSRLELEELRFRAAQAQSMGDRGVDVSALNNDIAQKEAELAANRKELMDLRIAFDLQQVQLANQINTQGGGQESYQALLDVERQKINSLESQVSQLTDSLASRQSDLSNSNAQLAALQRQLQAQAQNDQAATSASIAELSAIIEQQQQALSQKSENISTLESELARQREALASEQTAFQQRQQELQGNAQSTTAETQAALAQERARIATLQGEVASLSRELELKQSGAEQNNSQLDVLKRQLEIANSRRASSEESLADLSGVIAGQQADLEQKSLSISFLEQELANQKKQLETERLAYQQREKRLVESADVVQAEQQQMQTRLAEVEAYLATSQQKMIESDRLVKQQEADLLEQQQALAALREGQQQNDAAAIRDLNAQLFQKNLELTKTRSEYQGQTQVNDEMARELERLRNQVAMAEKNTTVAMRGGFTTPAAPAATPRPKPNVPNVNFGKYHALIIGNNAYTEFPSLKTPVNDAWAIAQVLEENYGFKTQVLINADRRAVLETINTYLKKLTEDDNFLLYYAGHGELDEQNNEGYWLPVDAGTGSRTDWISNNDITQLINVMTAKHIMVIADSCYSGTLTRGVRVTIEGGKSAAKQAEWYKKVSHFKSRTALTSGGTKPVQDGGGGDHSIFANSLLQTLESNNGVLEGPDLFQEVFKRMRSSGQNAIDQEPTFDVIPNTGDMLAPFFFVPT